MITNATSFGVELFSFLDAHAQELRIVVIQARYEVRPGQQPCPCDEQAPPRPTDGYFGEPARSSLRTASDLSLAKPAVDVLVSGSARATRGRSATVTTELRLANIQKQLVVSGNRRWSAGAPSEPDLFDRMPVVYERAFGGASPYCPQNPVGLGGSPDPLDVQTLGTEIANIEYPGDRVMTSRSRPRPAGYGPIAPWWAPRSTLAGTYDDEWLKEQSPLLPFDFDNRFFQVAPVDQQVPKIEPGEVVQLVGMTEEGVWRFALPTFEPEIRLLYAQNKGEIVKPKVDTILLEPDAYRLTLTARVVVRDRRTNRCGK